MAPSATSDLATPFSKVEISKQPAVHAHGAEDKTPLEAISHGPCGIVHPGMNSSNFLDENPLALFLKAPLHC